MLIMEKSYLIDIAKSAILEDLLKEKLIDKKVLLQKYPELSKSGATFVTLEQKQQLRGCIGSLVPHRTLLDDLISNAKSAAFSDTRFKPLAKNEFDDENFSVEVSILSEPKALGYKDIDDLKSKMKIGSDGVILKAGANQATFLPQVWEQLPNFEDFFKHLCQKAGLSANCLQQKPQILIYRVQKIKEIKKSKRVAGVMGQFYPSSCSEIGTMIKKWNQYLDKNLSDKSILKEIPKAIISPHAGYIYSGFTANIAYRLLANSDAKRVIVIGPSHRVHIDGLSASMFDQYQTPCGNMEIDLEYIQNIKKQYNMGFNKEAHKTEHSTETQMPFIKHYLPSAKIVELIYGKIDYKEIAKLINTLLRDKENVVVISTDLSHFHNLKKAKELDHICLKAIVEKKDYRILEQGCEACGITGVKAMLKVADDKKLFSHLLDYRTSADASGDESRVVGYVSAYFK